MLKCRALLFSLACLATTSATHAAILRADRSYSEFAALAGRGAFNAVAKISTGRGDYGSAVLLSDNVGITAASVLNNESIATVTVGGETRTISREDWVLRDGYRPSRTSPVNDIAIFRLTDPLNSGLSFAKVYRGQREIGKRLTYVGFESNRVDGDGDFDGPIALKNVFDGFGAETSGGFGFTDRDRLTIDFDDPLSDGSVLGRERSLKYEGVPEQGEHGGAAFIRNRRGKWRIAGIASATWSLFDDENNRVDTASFTRLSQHSDWINGYLTDASWTAPDTFGSYASGGTLISISSDGISHLSLASNPNLLSSGLAARVGPSATDAATSVPEPSSCITAIAAALAIFFKRRR